MANRKFRLSKPSNSSAGLNNKVRFRFEGDKAGYFIVANPKRQAIDGKKFKNHDEALAFALELQNK